jgi:hypothetical protein
MRAHHLIMADRGHLRIYVESRPVGQSIPSLELVQAMDFPDGIAGPAARDSDAAGRFSNGGDQAQGVSSDEHLSRERENSRRLAAHFGTEITKFFRNNPDATWDFAAAVGFHQPVLDHVATGVRRRLRHTLAKDLTKIPVTQLRPHLAAAGAH